MSDSLVPVAVACPCPGAPHSDGDTVFLGPKLDLRAGIIADAKIVAIANADGSPDEVKADLFEVYLLNGVKAWTFVDAEGTDVPVSGPAIRAWLMADYSFGLPIAEKADDLYSSAVMDPLLARMSKLLPLTPTNGSTSRKSGSSVKRPKPPRSSSTTTSPTAVIETT